MDRLPRPEPTRAPLDDVQREREPMVVCSQHERCARVDDGPGLYVATHERVECVWPKVREEDNVERGDTRVGTHEPRAACTERIFAGLRHDAQDKGAELAKRLD